MNRQDSFKNDKNGLDAIDKKILESLQKNGRLRNSELAREAGLAASSMLERVRRLEERGVIRGYRAVLDPRTLGFELEAIVLINLHRHQAGPAEEFEDRVRAVPEVMSCCHITGRYDYMLHVAVRDIQHLGELLKNTIGGIAGVEKQETFLVLSAIKNNDGYPLSSLPEASGGTQV